MKLFRSMMAATLLASAVMAMPVAAETAKAPAKPVTEQAQPAVPAEAPVNINAADAATLAQRLQGIGIKKAEAIVSYREQNGPFKSVDELVNVKGIGAATLEKNRSRISLN